MGKSQSACALQSLKGKKTLVYVVYHMWEQRSMMFQQGDGPAALLLVDCWEQSEENQIFLCLSFCHCVSWSGEGISDDNEGQWNTHTHTHSPRNSVWEDFLHTKCTTHLVAAAGFFIHWTEMTQMIRLARRACRWYCVSHEVWSLKGQSTLKFEIHHFPSYLWCYLSI